jgi:hypothetical protein
MNDLIAVSQLLEYRVEGELIHHRIGDGYINATAMCKCAKKQWNDYYRLGVTSAFLQALSAKTGIPVLELVQISYLTLYKTFNLLSRDSSLI